MLRVEVKISTWHAAKPGTRRGRYQANIRKRQGEADLVLFIARNGTDHFFVIPRADLRGRHGLTIRCYNPENYTGCLAEYRDAWHLVREALACVLSSDAEGERGTAEAARPYQTSLKDDQTKEFPNA